MAQAFLHGNGGTNPLNFKVVASVDYPASTSRNMIPDAYAKSATSHGITYTVNGDGSITANGTATGLSTLNVWGEINSLTLPAGTYTLSGCPSGGSASTYSLCNNNISYSDTGDGVTFNLTKDTAISFEIRITAGTTVSNLVFKPQLEKGSTATDFVKYAQKENTIWVKSGVALVYAALNQKPAPTWAGSKGIVFITYEPVRGAGSITASTATLNLLKKKANGVQDIYAKFTACYQNQDGTSSGWKKMNAYIYKSGSWVQFSAEFAATIAVTYPEGSTLTCSDGTTTLKATTTTGSYTFTVPNTGTWTVSCTNGTNTASNSVSITADGQSASVTLAYEMYLYRNGDKCTSVTGGWSGKTKGSEYRDNGSVTFGASDMTVKCGAYGSHCAYTTNRIDLSGWTTLHFTISTASNLSTNLLACAFAATDTTVADYGWSNVVASKYNIRSTGTYEVDVSKVSTLCHICIGIDSALNSDGNFSASEVWLTS